MFFSSNHEPIMTPKVHNVNWKNKILKREYVDGENLSKVEPKEAAEKIAKVLGTLHSRGWVLGDTKPTNFIQSNNKIYIVDAEQALKSKSELYMVWDVIASLIFLGIYNPLKAVIESMDMLITFLDNYRTSRGNVKIAERTLKILKGMKNIETLL